MDPSPPADALDFAEAMKLMRRIQRRRRRRDGPVKDPLSLPELDGLDLPILLPGQTVVEPPCLPGVRYYRPEGMAMVGAFEQVAAEAVGLLRSQDRVLARSTLFRGGVRLLVSTVFLPIDHSFDGGPPLLWETMVFHGGTRRAFGHGQECWRYASREAALAGHRQVVSTLREVQRLRRMAAAKPLRHFAYRPRLAAV